MMFGNGSEGPAESETGRLEAFSDGVLAVIITIMALELKAPVAGDFGQPARPDPGAACLHPELHVRRDLLEQPPSPAARRPPGDRRGDVGQPAPAVLALAHPGADRVDRRELREDRPGRDLRAGGPGVRGGLHGSTREIIRADGSASLVATAIGRDTKGRVSLVAYAAATGLAFVSPWISYALFAAVAVMWFVPDRRLSGR